MILKLGTSSATNFGKCDLMAFAKHLTWKGFPRPLKRLCMARCGWTTWLSARPDCSPLSAGVKEWHADLKQSPYGVSNAGALIAPFQIKNALCISHTVYADLLRARRTGVQL